MKPARQYAAAHASITTGLGADDHETHQSSGSAVPIWIRRARQLRQLKILLRKSLQ